MKFVGPGSTRPFGVVVFGRSGHLAVRDSVRHRDPVDEEQGIYRGEVMAIMLALARINADTQTIVGYIEGDDGDEEEEDLPDA